jgi:hypothetical protein
MSYFNPIQLNTILAAVNIGISRNIYTDQEVEYLEQSINFINKYNIFQEIDASSIISNIDNYNNEYTNQYNKFIEETNQLKNQYTTFYETKKQQDIAWATYVSQYNSKLTDLSNSHNQYIELVKKTMEATIMRQRQLFYETSVKYKSTTELIDDYTKNLALNTENKDIFDIIKSELESIQSINESHRNNYIKLQLELNKLIDFYNKICGDITTNKNNENSNIANNNNNENNITQLHISPNAPKKGDIVSNDIKFTETPHLSKSAGLQTMIVPE